MKQNNVAFHVNIEGMYCLYYTKAYNSVGQEQRNTEIKLVHPIMSMYDSNAICDQRICLSLSLSRFSQHKCQPQSYRTPSQL